MPRQIAAPLFLLWLASLMASELLPRFGMDGPLATALRLNSSVVLVLAAGLALQYPPRWLFPAAIGIFVGMAFGCLGDFQMARQLPINLFSQPELGGMVYFGIGHVAYIWAGWMVQRLLHRPPGPWFWLAILAWQLIGGTAWHFVVHQAGSKAELAWPALGYTALLAATAGVWTGVSCSQPRYTWVALGAALFLASDLVLAWRIFRGANGIVEHLVWPLYGPGQMLIVFGFLRTFRQPPTGRTGVAPIPSRGSGSSPSS